jgi:deoxycytidylate deaminase
MIINAGIEKIYYEEGYDDPLADQMLVEAGLEIVRLSSP